MSQSNLILKRLKRNLSLRAISYGARNWFILGILFTFLAITLSTVPLSALLILQSIGILALGMSVFAGLRRLWSFANRIPEATDRIRSWFSFAHNYVQLSVGIVLALVIISLLICISSGPYSLICDTFPALQPLLEAVHHCVGFLSDGFVRMSCELISGVAADILASLLVVVTALSLYDILCRVIKIIWEPENTKTLSTEEDVKITTIAPDKSVKENSYTPSNHEKKSDLVVGRQDSASASNHKKKSDSETSHQGSASESNHDKKSDLVAGRQDSASESNHEKKSDLAAGRQDSASESNHEKKSDLETSHQDNEKSAEALTPKESTPLQPFFPSSPQENQYIQTPVKDSASESEEKEILPFNLNNVESVNLDVESDSEYFYSTSSSSTSSN